MLGWRRPIRERHHLMSDPDQEADENTGAPTPKGIHDLSMKKIGGAR
jgi:hypothetical protein